MAFDYSPLAAVAVSLIADFGQDATVRRVSGGTYDPVTGTSTGDTTTDTSVRAVVVGIAKDYAEQLGGNVQAGDRMALIATNEPLVSDSLILGSETWAILDVQIVNPGGVALLYKAHVRR
jgi:hypothetical protein